MVDIDYAAFAKAIADIIPPQIYTLSKTLLIAAVLYFLVLIIKNIIQIGTAWRIRKISNNVEQINNKIDLLTIPSRVQTNDVEEEQQYMYT